MNVTPTIHEENFFNVVTQETEHINRFYFGTYLNMAHHNFYLIIKHISERVETKDWNTLEEEQLQTASLWSIIENPKSNTADKFNHATTLLGKHFPAFLHITKSTHETTNVEKIDTKKFVELLKKALKQLDKLRNYSSHYVHDAVNTEIEPISELADMLQMNIDKVVEEIPEISEEDIEHVKNIRLFDNQEYTLVGGVFLICLFLDRKNATTFLSGIKGFKYRGTAQYKALPEALTRFCCRPPQPRLGSADLEFNILTELSRCPVEIFRHLSDTDKEQFKSTELEPENEDAIVLENLGYMRRNSDRFPHLTMRYFDETQRFDRLRFQSWIGKINVARGYESEVLGVTKSRYMDDKLTTFARWDEISEDKLPSDWNIDDIKPFAPHYNVVGQRIPIKLLKPNQPAYFTKIKSKGTTEGGETFTVSHPLPDAILSTYEIQSLFLYDYLAGKGKAEELIEEYMKNYRKFITDFKNTKGKLLATWGDKIFKRSKNDYSTDERDELDYRREEVDKDLKEKYGIPLNGLPDKIKEHLLDYKPAPPDFLLRNKINRKIDEEETRLKKAERGRDLDGSKLKAGIIATYLAKDIVYFTDGRGLFNNERYNEMQKSIALFPLNKERLNTFFNERKLYDNKVGHQFLHPKDVSKANTVYEFYINYINAKIKWLKNCGRNINTRNMDRNEATKKMERFKGSPAAKFFKIDTKKSYDKNYLFTHEKDQPTQKHAPVMLPRGLFNEAIREALRAEGHDVPKKASVPECFDILLKGDTQTCYQMPRDYSNDDYQVAPVTNTDTRMTATDQLKQQIKSKKDEQHKFRKQNKKDDSQAAGNAAKDLKRLYKRVLDNEKRIRYTQSNDRALWLMTTEMFKQKMKTDENLDIKPGDSNWLLNHVGYDVAQQNIQDIPIEMNAPLQGRIITATLPVKQYGRFRKTLKDRRLYSLYKGKDTGLINYYPQGSTIPLAEIERELDIYEKQSFKQAITKIYEFEKTLATEHADKIDELKNNNNYEFLAHARLLRHTQDEIIGSPFAQPTVEQIMELRDRLMHNQIPYEQWLHDQLQNTSPQEKIKYLLEIVAKTYHEIISQIIH